MSTFHAAALSKELREALNTITSDKYWIESTRPIKPGQPVQTIEPVRPARPIETTRSASKRSLFTRASQHHHPPTAPVLLPPSLLSPAHQVNKTREPTRFPAVLREPFEEQNAKCLELIIAIDAYSLAWRHLEMPKHSRCITKGKLANALDELKQTNNKTLFDLRRSLKTSLHKYGRIVSKHQQCKYNSAYHEALYGCSLRFDDKIHHDESEASSSQSDGCDLKGRYDCGHYYCFHHPFGPLSSGWLFGDKDTGLRLSRIRFATSVAQFLVVAFQHAEKCALALDLEIEDDGAITTEWHQQIEAVERLNKASLALRSDERSNHVRTESSHFFDDLDLSHDDPLPLTAFVSQYLEVSDIDQDENDTGSWSHTHKSKAMAHDRRGTGTPDEMLLISNLLIAKRGQDNKHNAQLLERLDDLRRAHEQLMEQAGDLVSEMVSTNTQSKSSGNTTTESDGTAALDEIVRDYISGGSSSRNRIPGQYPHDRQYEYSTTEDRNGAGPSSFSKSIGTLRSPSMSHYSDDGESARPAYTSLESNPMDIKSDSIHSSHDSTLNEEAPPPYTPNCGSKEDLQQDTRSTGSAPIPAFTSEQQAKGHSPRLSSVRSSIQIVRMQPDNRVTTSEDAQMISHATGELSSEYFERILENQETA